MTAEAVDIGASEVRCQSMTRQSSITHRLQRARRHQHAPEAGHIRRFLRLLGPGLITGAADDDPSGIATYSQTGAQFGFTQVWTAL